MSIGVNSLAGLFTSGWRHENSRAFPRLVGFPQEKVSALETTGSQKDDSLGDRFPVFHEKGMGRGEDDVCFHSFDSGPGNRYFAVVRAVDHQAVDPVYGAASGDDAEFEVDGSELVWNRSRVRPKLASGGAVELLEEPPRAEIIDDFAAFVGRPKHHDAPELIRHMAAVIIPHKDAAERVGDKVNPKAVFEGGVVESRANSKVTEGLNVSRSGWVANVYDLKARLSQCRSHPSHTGPVATQPMEENDAFSRQCGSGYRIQGGCGRGA